MGKDRVLKFNPFKMSKDEYKQKSEKQMFSKLFGEKDKAKIGKYNKNVT